MTHIVLDNSIILSWCLADESDPIAEQAMQFTIAHSAVVPAIWWYELRNALMVTERRGRLSAADTRATLADLREMRIIIDRDHDEAVLLNLSRQHDLSVYDAAYLEVASRRALHWPHSTEGFAEQPPPVTSSCSKMAERNCAAP